MLILDWFRKNEMKPNDDKCHLIICNQKDVSISFIPTEVSFLLRYAESIRSMNLQERKCTNIYMGIKHFHILPKGIQNEHDTAMFKKTLKSFLNDSWINRR